jgi:Translation machinery associated TMA7
VTGCAVLVLISADAKANKEMAEKAKGKGPMNSGNQGIKKSGKK